MKLKEAKEALDILVSNIKLPDLNYKPDPCKNYDCPLFDGKCGQSPKSLNDYLNIAVSNYIYKLYEH